MVTTYTTRIWTGRVAANTTLAAVTVPAGKRLVVRNIHSQASTPGTSVALTLSVLGFTDVARVDFATSAKTVWLETRVVLHETEQLRVRALVSEQVVSLFGYLFDGPGPPLGSGPFPRED